MENQGRLRKEERKGQLSIWLLIVLTFCGNDREPYLTQYVVELVQVVFPGEDGLVGQHLSQDAAH